MINRNNDCAVCAIGEIFELEEGEASLVVAPYRDEDGGTRLYGLTTDLSDLFEVIPMDTIHDAVGLARALVKGGERVMVDWDTSDAAHTEAVVSQADVAYLQRVIDILGTRSDGGEAIVMRIRHRV